VLAVLGAAALYFMTAEERRRLARLAAGYVTGAIRTVRDGGPPDDALHELLFTRTRWVMVTPLLIALSVTISIAAGFGDGAALTAWGASYAPRTTNGEWWRLLTYAFVHGGVLHLLATIAALVPLGLVLERLVGRIAFAAVYVASALVASTISLWMLPATAVTAGASGAVSGEIGLLMAVAIYGYLRPPRMPASTVALKRLAAGIAIFALYNFLTDWLSTPTELAGLATGLVAGLAIARKVTVQKPAVPGSLLVAAAAAALALAAAVPLRGTIDARPEIARIADVESRTAVEYANAVDAYTRGRLSTKALAQVIERSVLPALEADRARVEALRGIPLEQKPLLVLARQYFDARKTSWKRRMEGLQRSDMRVIRDADRVERTALDQYDRLRLAVAAPPVS
jgi:membrane associated rhomboid family serine protease